MRGSYQTIWSFPLTNVKWHSVTRPYTMTTPYWSDFVPNSTFSGFHRIFVSDVACRQGTLTPGTRSRPFGTCICSTCWDQFFFPNLSLFFRTMPSNIPRYFLDFASVLGRARRRTLLNLAKWLWLGSSILDQTFSSDLHIWKYRRLWRKANLQWSHPRIVFLPNSDQNKMNDSHTYSKILSYKVLLDLRMKKIFQTKSYWICACFPWKTTTSGEHWNVNTSERLIFIYSIDTYNTKERNRRLTTWSWD